MITTPDRCPSPETIAAWIDHTLDRDRVDAHLAICDDCRALVASVDADLAHSAATDRSWRGLTRWIKRQLRRPR